MIKQWPDALIYHEQSARYEQSVKTLLKQSPSSESLTELWAHILEEERTLQRRFQVPQRSKRLEQVLFSFQTP